MAKRLFILLLAGAVLVPVAGFWLTRYWDPAWERNAGPLETVAGTYYFGDGLGVNCILELRPANRFKFTWSGCLGEYGSNFGRAELNGQELALHPRRSNPQGFGGTPTLFTVVRWGDRTYLVPREEMPDFCAAVNEGREPRLGPHGSFYLRRDFQETPPSGMPEIPPAWSDRLEKTAMRGTIQEVSTSGGIRVDLGTDHGVSIGAKLFCGQPRWDRPVTLRVTRVEKDHCWAEPELGGSYLRTGQPVVLRRAGAER